MATAKKTKRAKKAVAPRRPAAKAAVARKVDNLFAITQSALNQAMAALAVIRDAQADSAVKANLTAKLGNLQNSVALLKTELDKGSGEGVKSIGN
jgi:stage V sporulation protein SpoVS